MTETVIGIIGGMGPEAANRLSDLLANLNPVACDQEHVSVIVFNNSKIPSRSDALLCGGPNPLPELIRSAKTLYDAGCDFLLMPCNIAHCFLDQLQSEIEIPIINMIESTVEYANEKFPDRNNFGLLASTGTINFNLYQNAFARRGCATVSTNAIEQDSVMNAIYGRDGIKCGYKEWPRQALLNVAEQMLQREADALILGCTEISLVLSSSDFNCPVIDPLIVVAEKALLKAGVSPIQRTQTPALA